MKAWTANGRYHFTGWTSRYYWTPVGEDQKSIGVGDIVIYADQAHSPINGRTFAIVRKVADQSPHVELQLAEPGDIVVQPDGAIETQRDPKGAIKQRVPWIGLCDGGDQPRWNFLQP